VFYFTPNLQLLSESRQFLEVGLSPVNVVMSVGSPSIKKCLNYAGTLRK